MSLRLTLRVFFLFLLGSLDAGNLVAQSDSTSFSSLKIGDWEQHLPWQRSLYVTQSDSKVYFATEWAMVEIDKADRSPHFITKVEGLSDVGMNLIRYNEETGTVVMVYNNSNIDLYRPADGTVINLPFIKKNVNIIGDKKIYSIAFDGKFAYLACGFGILKLNLERGEVEYTVFTNLLVRSFAIFENNLYAGTDEGAFRLPVDDVNPADFGRWQMLGPAEGFVTGESVGAMAVWNNQLYVGIKNLLYRYDQGGLNEIAGNADRDVYFLTAEGAGLVIGWKRGFDGSVEYLEPGGNRYNISSTCDAGKPFYTVEDGNRKFWISDDSDQFRYFDAATNQCDAFVFNSPYSHTSTEITIVRDKVYVGTPGIDANFGPGFFKFGVYIFENGTWKRLTGQTNPELIIDDCNNDMWRVAAHPTEDKFYVGSFVGGLIESNGARTATKCYTKDNSILQDAGQSGSSRTAISGLAFDTDKNLWIANYGATAPIAVLKADGTLRNFPAAPAANLTSVVVDQNGYKWFTIGFNGGVMVYDSGKDLDNPADDRYKIFTSSNSVLPTNTVNCLAVDLDGDVWVGTQQGTISFECGSNVFDGACTGRRRIINVDGFNGYLLETEDVRSIAVDGGNRKWFGTTNGIFVQSADGLTQEGRFTNTNSPLFDNNITDIAINQKNGEVWIGTEKGIISLRGEATAGGKINSAMPYAYPNPVEANYDGPIAIYGLARDANVKITDVAGNLVYEGQALGGQAVWNGRDYLGRRVTSGVYLVFATSVANFENPDAIITKVVILN